MFGPFGFAQSAFGISFGQILQTSFNDRIRTQRDNPRRNIGREASSNRVKKAIQNRLIG